MKGLSVGKQRGFSTLEILIAFAILTLALVAVILVVFSNQTVAVDSVQSNGALYRAEGLLETARALSRQNFSSVTSVATSTDSIYQKSLVVTDIDSYTKQAIATVSWQNAGRTLYTALTTLLTNPDPTNSCGSGLISGEDWRYPQHYDYSTTSIIPGNNSNGIGIADVKVFNNMLYVAANSASNSGDSFYIFTLPSLPSSAPTYAGSVNTDTSNGAGLMAVTVAKSGSKTYAYLANASSFSKGQLQVVDVTNPTTSGWSPTIVSFKIPTTAVPSAGLGNSIYYKNGYIYLGLTAATGGKEFNIIDVHNPLSPVWKGGYSTSAHDVNAIYVSGNYAYLATPNNENLTVLDISDPTNPTRVGGYTPANLPNSEGSGSDHGESLFMFGSTLYLGRTYGTNELMLFNASTPASLSVIASKDAGTGNKTNINSIVVRGTLLFTLTNAQFQVWDISSPASPVPYTSDGTINTFLSLAAFGGAGTELDCAGDYFYTALASSQGNNKDVISIITAGQTPFDYSIAAPNASVTRGSQTTVTVTLTKSSGTAAAVMASLSGLPNKTSYTPASQSCTPNGTCTVTFTITAQSNASKGTSTITVSGSSPSHTATFSLSVN